MNWKANTASLALALLMLVSSCGGREPNAIGAAAIQVGMTAVNRALTGDCWGVCEYGTRCNRSSGYCEADPEPQVTPSAPEPATSNEQATEAALLPLASPSTNDPPSSSCTEAASCAIEAESCSASHDECIRRCECRDARWSCLETCR